MGFKHPDFLHTSPLEVALKPEELKKYYMDKDCCFIGIEGDHWVDMIACNTWPDIPYYTAYFHAISSDWLNSPDLFADKMMMLTGRVVDIEDIPDLCAGEIFVLLHKDITLSTYEKLDNLIAVIESLYHDKEIEIDLDDLTLLVGITKTEGWRQQMVRQMLRWTKTFDLQRRNASNIVIAGEASLD